MLAMNRGVWGLGMSRLLLDRIIDGDCGANLAARPDGCVDPVFADPPYHLQLNGDLHQIDNSPADAGVVLVSPNGHLTARVRADGSMLAARTAHSDGVPLCLL